jgi:hypothetical protein
LIFACTPAAALGVACGLDETGLFVDASLDVTTNEGGLVDVAPYDVLNDVPLPPSCTNVDLSCLGFGAGLPDGWSPYITELDGGACPPGDFEGTPWVTNTRLQPGSCACTCTPVGTWSCPSEAGIATGATGCGLTNGPAAVGQCQSQNGFHIQLDDASASGTVSCNAGDAGPAAPLSDPVTLCSFGCEAGASVFCAAPAGSRCIVTDGIQTCPGSGLTAHYVGASAAPSCAQCGCNPLPAPNCDAVAYLFHGYLQGSYRANNNCDDGGIDNQNTMTTLPLDGGCQNVNGGFDSFEVQFGSAPPAKCNSGQGSGDAGLASPKTVCCN